MSRIIRVDEYVDGSGHIRRTITNEPEPVYMIKPGKITECGGSGNCHDCERVDGIILVRKCTRDTYVGYKFIYPARLNTGKWCSAIKDSMVTRVTSEKDLLVEISKEKYVELYNAWLINQV